MPRPSPIRIERFAHVFVRYRLIWLPSLDNVHGDYPVSVGYPLLDVYVWYVQKIRQGVSCMGRNAGLSGTNLNALTDTFYASPAFCSSSSFLR